jgi:GTP-binding protein
VDDASDSDHEEDESSHGVLRHRSGVRNVAIIAHVDHGKTTLVDQLLRSAAASSDGTTGSSDNSSSNNTDRLLDCGDLEKERGITITSKVTRIDNYLPTQSDENEGSGSHTINLVDTPGHADFCGEVDRVLSLVDGVCLVVDAGEGPMAQTKYVLSRALQANLPIVVVLNKVDRKVSFDKVVEGDTEISLEELMEQLGASEEQIRFSLEQAVFYASARDGWITQDLDVLQEIVEEGTTTGHATDTSMGLLLDKLLDLIPEPSVKVYTHNDESPSAEGESSSSLSGEAFRGDAFSLAAVTVGYDSYLGRTCTGRITSGHVTASDTVTVLRRRDNDTEENAAAVPPATTLKGLFVNRGISRVPLDSQVAYSGDIVTLAGVPDSIQVGDTITSSEVERMVSQAIHTPPLVPPTLQMEFAANNGPLAGTEGTEVTPSKLRNRLVEETDNNVTLTVEASSSDSEKTTVYARGELQLGILIEQMRREGFEMVISPPNIVTHTDEATGTKTEPYEEVTIDVDTEYSGYIVSALTSDRKGVLLEMHDSGEGDASKTRLVFEVPSRGLLGFPSEAAAATRGSAIVNHVYLEDRKHAGPLGDGLEKGKLVSSERGKATAYALASLAARGVLFVEPGDVVYPGMILGENAKPGDLEVNPVRAKAATNMRTQNKDEKVYLAPPKQMTIEELIGYMAPDEMIEVTPSTLRLRKAELDPVERKKATRAKKQQQDAAKRK